MQQQPELKSNGGWRRRIASPRRNYMWSVLTVLLIVGAYLLLTQIVLPKIGIPT